jgi:uncharacterized protein YkwD
VPALEDDARLAEIAEAHSKRMADAETIYHNEDLADELPPYNAAGENVGMGDNCDQINDAFLASPGHYENMVAKEWNHVGIGVTIKGDTMYVVEDFADLKAVVPKSTPKAAPKQPPSTSAHR